MGIENRFQNESKFNSFREENSDISFYRHCVVWIKYLKLNLCNKCCYSESELINKKYSAYCLGYVSFHPDPGSALSKIDPDLAHK